MCVCTSEQYWVLSATGSISKALILTLLPFSASRWGAVADRAPSRRFRERGKKRRGVCGGPAEMKRHSQLSAAAAFSGSTPRLEAR